MKRGMGILSMDACTHAHRAQPDPATAERLFIQIKIAPRLRSPLRGERVRTHVHGQDAHATGKDYRPRVSDWTSPRIRLRMLAPIWLKGM